MQERLRSAFKNSIEKWNGLEKKHRVRIIAIGVMFLIALSVAIYLSLRPKMVVIYENLDYPTLTSVRASLDEQGIPNTIRGTNVLVNEKFADNAIVHVESQNLISESEFTYRNALDYSGMSTTETIKKGNMLQAKQTELAQMMRLFKGVQGSKVVLSIPDSSSNFLVKDEDKASTASVVLTVNNSFDRDSGETMARIVSRSVSKLDVKNVEIVDQNAEVIYSGMSLSSGSASLSQMDAKEDYENNLAQKIRTFLAPFATQVHVVSNIAFNWDSRYETSKKYNLPSGMEDKGLLDQQRKSSSSFEGTNTDAEPGIMSNDQVTPTYPTGAGGNSSASTSEEDSRFLHDITELTIDGSVGVMVPDSSGIAVIMYQDRIYEEAYMTDNNLLNNQTWIEFKEANNGNKIPLPADELVGLLDSLKISTRVQNFALSGYYLVSCIDKDADEPLNVSSIVVFAILAILILLLALALLRVSKPQEIVEIEPELSIEELLVSTQLEERYVSDAAKLREIELGEESEFKKQIDKFIEEKPEAVAQLLRNWLSDEWE